MQTHEGKIRRTIALFLLIAAMSLIGAAAMAQKPAEIAHIALTQKIVKDAGDRRGVRFISTHIRKVDAYRRSVTGEGCLSAKAKARSISPMMWMSTS